MISHIAGIVVPLLTVVSAHIRLMYPFPRQYAINSLNNIINPVGACGMPRGEVATELLMGSSLNVTWAVGQPHEGGFRVELLDKEYNLLSTLIPVNGTADQFYGNNTVANIAHVTLPSDINCNRCVLRIVKQAAHPDANDSPFGFVYRTCADIGIAARLSSNNVRCSHRGTWNGTSCECKRPFLGTACEFEEECFDDADCANGGKCLNTHAQFFPKRKCYCPAGWMGRRCATESKHKDVTFTPLLYRKRVTPDKNLTLYWRIIEETKEIEFVIEAKTNNWVAIGWRPDSINNTCKKFPRLARDRLLSVSKDGGLAAKTLDYLGQSYTALPLHAMSCTDVVTASAFGQYCRIRDQYIRDFHTPVDDELFGGKQSLTAGHCFENSETGVLHVMFRKKLTASDPVDHSLSEAVMHVIWAVGETPYIPQANDTDSDDLYREASLETFYRKGEVNSHAHRPSGRGVFKVDLANHDNDAQ